MKSKIVRSVLRLICCSFFILTGCTTMPAQKKIPTANTEHIIYFIYREWHTSILIDAKTVARYSRLLQHEAADQAFIRFGWGDGNYFTGKSKTLGSATKALVASSHSALQVIAYAQSPFADISPETRVAIALTDVGMRRLIQYLDESLVLNTAGHVIPLEAYVTNAGHFYQARGHYSVLSNCNTWSGRALQSAELPVRSSLQLTAKSVFEQARFIHDYQLGLGLVTATN